MAIRSVDHIDMAVRDVAQYVEFFERMGFRTVVKTMHHGGSVEMQLPEKTADGRDNGESRTIFEFHSVHGEQNPGVYHIAFGVDNVDETVAEMKGKGVKFQVEHLFVKETGRVLANFRDPDCWRMQLTDMARDEAQKDTSEPEEGLGNKPDMMKNAVRAVDHIELIVRDAAQYAEFFEKMGFKCVLKSLHHGGSFEMQLPEKTPDGKDNGEFRTIFELHTIEGYELPGLNHIAFLVDNVDETVAEMKKNGVTFEEEHRLVKETGRLLANFRSPDGWRVQLADMARVEAQEM